MSSVNKQSVRDEFTRIETEFVSLRARNKISNEGFILFQSMLTLMKLLISIFLEKNTTKTDKNSSKPPSQTEKDESGLTEPGTKSKGKMETDACVDNRRTIETVTRVSVTQCDVCGNDLTDVPCQHVERRTKIDIIFEKTVEHVDVETKICEECGTTVKGSFAPDMPGALQYGNGLKAFVINLGPGRK